MEEAARPTIRVFNKAKQLKYWLVPEGEVELQPGVWTANVSEDVAIRYLIQERDLLFDWGNPPPQAQATMPLPQLTFACPIDIATGYGNAALSLIPRLAEHYNLQLFPLAYWRRDGVSPVVLDLMETPPLGHSEWALALTIPTELPHVPSPRIVLYSMWETGRLHDGWAELVNTHAEQVIVPCQDQAQVWQTSGVELPISVVPLGVDTDLWAYQERPARDAGEPFTILLHGILSSRKSPLETLMEVCWRAFTDVDDWHLLVKTRHGALGAGMFTPRIRDPHVRVISEDYYAPQMVELCHQSDLFLFLSKYEGFGLPPREAMSTGLPVIWTAAHGHLEDCGQGVTVDIPIKGPVPAGEMYEGLGGWVMPDWEAAAEALRAEYEDWHRRGRSQSPLGTKAAAYIRQHRTWDHTATGLISILSQLKEPMNA